MLSPDFDLDFFMTKIANEFTFEYQYAPLPDAEEQLAQAWDIIFALILEDYQNEQRGNNNVESEPC